jgi:hypothetical protein
MESKKKKASEASALEGERSSHIARSSRSNLGELFHLYNLDEMLCRDARRRRQSISSPAIGDEDLLRSNSHYIDLTSLSLADDDRYLSHTQYRTMHALSLLLLI